MCFYWLNDLLYNQNCLTSSMNKNMYKYSCKKWMHV